MPKIYEYLGIIIFFYSNEHEPIHVHAKKGGCESKAEFHIVEGKIEKISIKKIKGKKPMKGNDLKEFSSFLGEYAESIVDKWVDYFVYHKTINCERISKRIK